jgi:hypothetical protein
MPIMTTPAHPGPPDDPDLQVNPIRLLRYGHEVLATANSLVDAGRAHRRTPPVATAVFGNSDAGPQVADALESAHESLFAALDQLVEVFEGDADRLVQAAFAYEAANKWPPSSLPPGRSPGTPA